MRSLSKLAVVATACALGAGAQAQSNVKPPKVQLWMDVSTGGMAGMPEMPAGAAGMAGLFGGPAGAGGGGASTT